MSGTTLECAEHVVQAAIDAVRSAPRLTDAGRIAVIAFNDDAWVAEPMAAVDGTRQSPTFVAAGGANYTRAFQLLRERMEGDYRALRSEGVELSRPFVLFVVAGLPTCDGAERATALAALSVLDATPTPDMAVLGIGHRLTRDELMEYRMGRGAVDLVLDGYEAVTVLVVAQMIWCAGADVPDDLPLPSSDDDWESLI